MTAHNERNQRSGSRNQDGIFAEIREERRRQNRIWDNPEHDKHNGPNDWIALITKHVGQAVHWPWTARRFRHEMVIVAALAVAAIEWVDADGDEAENTLSHTRS
jgi:hypothetical protein